MKGYLLDVNVLIALAWPNHLQHATAHEWFSKEQVRGWGTCGVTQIGFVRVSSHPALEYHVSTQQAWQKIQEIVSLPTHSFWGGQLATFDRQVVRTFGPLATQIGRAR